MDVGTRISNIRKVKITPIHLLTIVSSQRKFSKLGGTSGRCLAVAPDLSPHYRRRLKIHRYLTDSPHDFLRTTRVSYRHSSYKNFTITRAQQPESKAGDPGSLSQGLNTGVMLYHLDCLRDSMVTFFVKNDNILGLATKFLFQEFNSQLEEGSVTQLVYK